MGNEVIFDSNVYQWVILPLIIFCARICDMSIDTVRILLMARGKRLIVPVLGFIEMMIWLLVVRQIFLNLSNFACLIAYAGGFAVGTFIGMVIEEKLAIGYQVIRAIVSKDAAELIEKLKSKGFGVTKIDAQGATGEVDMIYIITQRKNSEIALNTLKEFSPKAFYTIEDIQTVKEGVFPATARHTGLARKSF